MARNTDQNTLSQLITEKSTIAVCSLLERKVMWWRMYSPVLGDFVFSHVL